MKTGKAGTLVWRMWMLMGTLVLVPALSPCQAGVGLSAKIGTLGYGGDLSVALGERVNARIGFNTLDLDIELSDEDSDAINLNVSWQTLAGLLDWHPGGGGFRLSAGLMLNNNELTLSASPGDTVELNGELYTVDSLDGTVDFEELSPYVGIGVGNAASGEGHWRFAFDLGVLFHGAPSVSMRASASDPLLQDLLNADLAEEAKEIEDDAVFLNWYPVVSLGLSYCF